MNVNLDIHNIFLSVNEQFWRKILRIRHEILRFGDDVLQVFAVLNIRVVSKIIYHLICTWSEQELFIIGDNSDLDEIYIKW